MVLQNEKLLIAEIQRYGCYWGFFYDFIQVYEKGNKLSDIINPQLKISIWVFQTKLIGTSVPGSRGKSVSKGESRRKSAEGGLPSESECHTFQSV
jgi:hypothetical protein